MSMLIKLTHGQPICCTTGYPGPSMLADPIDQNEDSTYRDHRGKDDSILQRQKVLAMEHSQSVTGEHQKQQKGNTHTRPSYLGLFPPHSIDYTIDCRKLGTNCQDFVAYILKDSALFIDSSCHSCGCSHHFIKLQRIAEQSAAGPG